MLRPASLPRGRCLIHEAGLKRSRHASCAGLRDAIIAAHGAWSKTAAALMEPHAAAVVGEEGLGGEGFTMVDGIDEDGSAGAAPAAAADIEGDACAHMATILLSESRSS